MLNVVLLAINAKYVHSSLSVWVIAAGVSQYARFPHKVNVVETTINQKTSDIADAVASHTPDIIGISSYIWNAGILPELIKLLRGKLPEVIFVLGGPEASNNIDYWLECGVDHVLKGEGEYNFPQFLDFHAKSQRDASHVLSADPTIAGSEQKSHDPVDPYTEAFFNALNGRLSYIETSRGCPFQCSFCLSAGSDVQYFPLDSVKRQILKLSLSNTKTIKFVDRTFNCNASRAYDLFEYVKNLDTTCCFHFEVAADLFDDRTLSLLETAPPGRIQFEIGLQSYFEPALKASSRIMDIEKAELNIHALMKKQNIHIHIDLIAGLPNETLSDFMKSFDRAYSLKTHNLQLGFLKLLHGSVLREQAEGLGLQYSQEPPYELTCSPWLSADDTKTLKQAENALQNTRNKGRFLSTLEYVLTSCGESPFIFMRSLGEVAPNYGTQLEDYVLHLYEYFIRLPGVDKSTLKDCMIYDWLSMVKGKNAPSFLKNDDPHRERVAAEAEKRLGRSLRREEYAVLSSGSGIFVDSGDQNPVTGLYKVYSIRKGELLS